MTLFQALNVIAECEKAEREERPDCHCEYGHIDCSFKPKGPCFDDACMVVEGHEVIRESYAALIAENERLRRLLDRVLSQDVAIEDRGGQGLTIGLFDDIRAALAGGRGEK